jgi:hypothetical protein
MLDFLYFRFLPFQSLYYHHKFFRRFLSSSSTSDYHKDAFAVQLLLNAFLSVANVNRGTIRNGCSGRQRKWSTPPLVSFPFLVLHFSYILLSLTLLPLQCKGQETVVQFLLNEGAATDQDPMPIISASEEGHYLPLHPLSPRPHAYFALPCVCTDVRVRSGKGGGGGSICIITHFVSAASSPPQLQNRTSKNCGGATKERARGYQ